MPRFYKISTIIFFLCLFSGCFLTPAFAQTDTTVTPDPNVSLGIATNAALTEPAETGDIITSTKDGLSISTTAYDTNIAGIVSLKPAISLNFDTVEGQNIYPVIKSGTALVKISLTNGEIKKGDSITTSSIKGVGMKAVESGYIVGTSLEDFSDSDKNAQKLLNISLDVHYFNSNTAKNPSLFDIFSLSTTTASQEPFRVLKYILAAAVVIISIVIGFVSFGKLARSGVEALGRNPLASKTIQLGIIFNTVICIAVIGVGLFVGTLIMRI